MNTKAILITLAGLILIIGLSALAAILISSIELKGIEFNKEGLVTGLIAFDTSAIVATFLTLFHSENKRIKYFRSYKLASATMYMTVLMNTAIVSATPLFMTIDKKIVNFGVDNFVTVLAILLTIQVAIYLFMLMSLFTKD